MNYRFWRDPLWISCLLLYFLSRWLLKPHIDSVFLRSYLNDCLCVPFWTPLMVWGMRRIGWRAEDTPPQRMEVVVLIVVFAVAFEMWLPHTALFRRIAHADPFDVLAYTVGGFLAVPIWDRQATPQEKLPSPYQGERLG